MTEKAGFLGLGTAGGVAAGGAAVAVIVGTLYATGVLAPAPEPAAVAQTAQTEPAPTETAAPAPENATPAEPAPTADAPAPEAPVAEADPTVDPAPNVPVAETDPTVTPEPEVPMAEADQTVTPTPAASAAVAPLGAPAFDVVRASPDGTTVIAGRADPGSIVELLVDGQVTDTQTADAQGDFVSLLTLEPSTNARVVTLRATLDEREALSADEIILAPTPAPQVAVAEPAPAASTPQTVDPAAETAQAETPAPVEADRADPVQTALADTATQADNETPAQSETPTPTSTQTAALAQDATPEPTAEPQPEPAEEPQPAPVAVLRADQDGVELVQPATSEPARAAEQIALDTIGYSPDGDVLLSGRSDAGALIRIYLDNSARADVTADGDGRWRARIDGIAPGVYTLRLDALDAGGAVISRLETPFKRESPAALASAQADTTASPTPAPISQVTVQAGDTLWAISRERYGDGFLFVRLFEANRDAIRNPDLIYPGQIFTIPD